MPQARVKKGRNGSPEWERLRRDVPTFICSAAVYLASLALCLMLLGLTPPNPFPQAQPLFWIVAIPLTFWASALRNYGKVPVLILKTLMVLDIPIGVLLVITAYMVQAAEFQLFILALAVVVLMCLVAFFSYQKSFLKTLQ